jgi:hypothetical protein
MGYGGPVFVLDPAALRYAPWFTPRRESSGCFLPRIPTCLARWRFARAAL